MQSVEINPGDPINQFLFAFFLIAINIYDARCDAVLDATGSSATALATATAAMGSVSLCNGLGRLLNGFIWDKLGYRFSLLWVSLAFTAGMLCCAIAAGSGNFPLMVVGFILLGLMFGGTMSTTSAVVGTFFGTKYFGINYAIMCCQMIPAAFIGPTLLAIAQTSSGSYGPAFWVFLGLAVATFVFSFAVRRPKAAPEVPAKAEAPANGETARTSAYSKA